MTASRVIGKINMYQASNVFPCLLKHLTFDMVKEIQYHYIVADDGTVRLSYSDFWLHESREAKDRFQIEHTQEEAESMGKLLKHIVSHESVKEGGVVGFTRTGARVQATKLVVGG